MAALVWLAVNLPVFIVAPSGWATFYVFSQNRDADWGSIWYLFEYYSVPKLGNYQLGMLNEMSAAALIIAFAGIALLALAAPRRPSAAAALLPAAGRVPDHKQGLVAAVRRLAGAARGPGPAPLWPYVLWQLAEVWYFFGIWGYLIFVLPLGHPSRLPGHQRGLVLHPLAARFLTVALLAAYVVRDILFRNGTWCVPTATMTRPGVSWTRPRTGSGSGSRCRSGAQVLVAWWAARAPNRFW